ncbi:Desmoglein-2 [Dissostichus eleginoides]|uniref:Desmoglein-2 n=1 Tax=Dissostichus eleginoides TaxID=100907 RepID=A0AAD9F8W9_DISEL|nr:Desmoglein-2 [Dissostichus eleginoides]
MYLLQTVAVVKANSEDNLVRRKRVWIPPPKQLMENEDYTQEKAVAKIHSDFDDDNGNMKYSLEGIGANQHPFNVFVVDHRTGDIRLTKILDRELIDTYNLSGVAKYKNGMLAEENVDIRFKVKDQNDNPPVFGVMKAGEVPELSRPGTSVMKITATDADEPGNKNSQIAYTILHQNPPDGMFGISQDGTIYVKNPALDRERVDQYILTVQGQDLNGAPGGHSATSTVVIDVKDVNDNLPTLEKSEYEASIEENTEGVEVMRIKAEDVDMRATDSWEAVFDIVKGNEAGYFSIKTDPATNEGILMLDKAVNYEDVKNLELGLAVRNKASPYVGSGGASGATFGSGASSGSGGASGSGGSSGSGGASGGSGGGSGTKYNTYPIKINVKNQPEGPSFDPKVKAIPISEGGSVSINEVIGSYTALDGDTGKAAENVRYVKGSDPGNWLTIDPKTAEIKLNKMPDRESPYLINGTYFAQVLCITEDMPSKTATGTVAIQVEDFNDHCPTLTSDFQTVCTPHDAVIVEAKDEDFFPNGAPFVFEIIPEGTKGKWQVEHYNDTAAILRAKESLWPGLYEVTFVVKDQQGQACPEPQKVTVQVCTCEDGEMCGERGKNVLLLLLLFCKCGDAAGFTEMPFDTKSHLINYRTEGQGENTEVPLLNFPVQQDANMVMAKNTFASLPMAELFMEKVSQEPREKKHGGISPAAEATIRSLRAENQEEGEYDGMALPDHFLGQYYGQKVRSENENLGGKDGLLVYDYEGQGSLAGSVGCCSLLESENDLQFLDDLGMKFKTLAEVCGGKKIQTEVKPAFIPQPSPSIHTHTSASSVMTQQMPPPSHVQPPAPQTVVREKSESSQVVMDGRARAMEGMTTVKTGRTTVNEGMTTVNTGRTTVNEGMMNQGQMILLQPQPQPVYYTTANPVLQQMQYMVQPQVQNTVMLAEAPTSNLQGMVLLNGTQTGHAQGMVVQGQTMMSSGQAGGQRMVLLDGNGIHGSGGNFIHTGNLSGSQTMMVVEGNGIMEVSATSSTLATFLAPRP